MTAELVVDRIRARHPRSLARAATAIENRNPEAEPLLRALFPHSGRAALVGITGAPGAGKSTLVDQLTRALRAEQQTVGVLAVDPTSPYSGGAILGDRIRMTQHYADDGVFIRSMASRGALGGVARATSDLALLLDAAGFDHVLVETVGVGQDEVEIARMAHCTVAVLVPGLGDDVQALKAGIMEIADVFLINKADLPGADKLEREIQFASSLAHRGDGWTPPIVRTVASEGRGIAEALAAVRGFLQTGPRHDRAVAGWQVRLRELFLDRVAEFLTAAELARAAEDVAGRQRDPYSVVAEWLARTIKA